MQPLEYWARGRLVMSRSSHRSRHGRFANSGVAWDPGRLPRADSAARGELGRGEGENRNHGRREKGVVSASLLETQLADRNDHIQSDWVTWMSSEYKKRQTHDSYLQET
ncbi:uncharacterized protein PG986_011481 [Apiospora aurea]|uniref:Uncharacterized protein n=1 Tax=Apiospora aurea TaxID=335848 RepID=A0ABR1Q596_9PEZI